MAQDKKVKRGSLTFILARGIGESFIARDVAPDEVRSFLRGGASERLSFSRAVVVPCMLRRT